MRIALIVSRDEYEQLSSGDIDHIDGPIELVMVRQQDSQLAKLNFRCRYAEQIGPEVAHTRGLPSGQPLLRLWLTPEGASE